MNGYRSHVLAAVAILVGMQVARPAHAASSQKVTQSDWWAGVTGLPSYVNMYIYVPDQPATKPPIVVVPHHCQGTASSSHSESSGLESLANKNGFIIIYPEATGQNCWDAGSTRSLKHDGKGDTHAIAQMVRYTITKYSADATRVYSVGGSSGGIMTEALLGVYPDVFMAGVSLMGVPCGCWAEQYNDTTGSGSTAQWSGPCAGGTVTKTGQQWGDLVRSYFPGYTGHRPRLQHWHGTSDTTLNYKVMAEDIKEWTNVLGLAETPSGSDTPKSGTTHQFWKNSCYTVYETFALSGVGHSVSFDATAVAAYFGLDKVGGQDPETAACPGAVPGGSGAGGAGGGSGTGGTTGAGGATGMDGGTVRKDGGRETGAADSASPEGTGGTTAVGGAPGTGGSGAGGKQETGGRPGSGGTSASGGDRGSGGAAGKGGSSTEKTGGSSAGGESGAGGTVSSGGSSAKGGSSTIEGSGGKRVETANGGCAIAVASPVGAPLATVALFLTTLGLALRRRQRPPRP